MTDSPLLGDATATDADISYFNGQQLRYNNFVNETQDRASIASKSGFPNVNDITGITRGEAGPNDHNDTQEDPRYRHDQTDDY